MKIKTALLFLIFVVVFSHCTTKEQSNKNFWTTEKSFKHLLDRQDSSTWDLDLFKEDLKNLNNNLHLLLEYGVFPEPKYDLIGKGSFTGLGNYSAPGGEAYEYKIENKTILYNSFFVSKNELNKMFLGDKKDEVFFQIIILTDLVDTVNYSHSSSQVLSRNHPDYIGQGSFKTKNNKIDYLAFITANRNSYAVINMRLFDLQMGKTILIAPQTDKSFRSLQIKSPQLTKDELDEYTEKLLTQNEIRDFFTKNGNI